MLTQTLVVAVVVAWAGLYAAWTLMPQAARRALARGLLRLPLPDLLADHLRRAAHAVPGCGGCDGCPPASPKAHPPGLHTKNAKTAAKPLVWHPRRRR